MAQSINNDECPFTINVFFLGDSITTQQTFLYSQSKRLRGGGGDQVIKISA